VSELVTVARVDDVPPGTAKAVAAGDEPIALVNVDGMLYALQGKCLHLEGPLGEGRVEGCYLTCPWHGWTYDVRTGKNNFDLAIEARTYPVQVEDGEVKVEI
jgi:nitrite reductase (NADH) small subunit